MIKGRMRLKYTDRDEVINTVEVFYMQPGHIPVTEEDCELVWIAPKGETRKVMEVLRQSEVVKKKEYKVRSSVGKSDQERRGLRPTFQLRYKSKGSFPIVGETEHSNALLSFTEKGNGPPLALIHGLWMRDVLIGWSTIHRRVDHADSFSQWDKPGIRDKRIRRARGSNSSRSVCGFLPATHEPAGVG